MAHGAGSNLLDSAPGPDSVPSAHTRPDSFEIGQRAVIWEFHTEFVTITWRAEPSDDVNWPDDIGIECWKRRC